MRKAVCVGINYYAKGRNNCLNFCVNDALCVAKLLEFNGDAEQTRNFDILPMIGRDESHPVTKHNIEDALDWLFNDDDPEIALFYFAGHGSIDSVGGYLCTSEITRPNDGLSLHELMTKVAKSKAQNKIIILDSCHSGFAADSVMMPGYCQLPPNTTILAACRDNESADEDYGHGIFTALLLDALEGGASNILGEVSPGSIYAYIDRSLGAFDQRPVFKANIKNFISIRKNKHPISLPDLRRLTELFEYPSYEFPLDPTYEKDKNYTDNKEVNEEHEKIFDLLRKFYQLGLVVPIDEEYMYWAAIHSTGCKLTVQGKHYWTQVYNKII